MPGWLLAQLDLVCKGCLEPAGGLCLAPTGWSSQSVMFRNNPLPAFMCWQHSGKSALQAFLN